MTKPKVILVMIVKDEAPIIEARLKAVLPHIDAWCIIDTGSTDDTFEIVRTTMAVLPGFHGSHEWAGFADARTHALDVATKWAKTSTWAREEGGEWWALLLDADTIFHPTPGWRDCLVGDVVEADVHHGALRYVHPRILRLSGHQWRWRGVLHEYLEVPAGMRHAISYLVHVEHGGGGARERQGQAVKFRNDAELLAKVRAENLEPDLDARYAFYEAQSWRDCGEIDLAIERYMERGRMEGWFGETYIAWLRAGELLWAKENWPGAYACWTAAWAVDSTRAESLIGLASLLRARSFWVPCFEFAKLAQKAVKLGGVHGLFADVNIMWRADYEMAVAGSWVATLESTRLGRQACKRLLDRRDTPAHIKALVPQWLEDFYPASPRARKVSA